MTAEPLTAEEEAELRRLLGSEISGEPGSVLDVERRLLATLDAARREQEGLDVERLRLVFHYEYERQYDTGGCRHQNQHQKSWDCHERAVEFIENAAAQSQEASHEVNVPPGPPEEDTPHR